jgi:hypothetical protein
LTATVPGPTSPVGVLPGQAIQQKGEMSAPARLASLTPRDVTLVVVRSSGQTHLAADRTVQRRRHGQQQSTATRAAEWDPEQLRDSASPRIQPRATALPIVRDEDAWSDKGLDGGPASFHHRPTRRSLLIGGPSVWRRTRPRPESQHHATTVGRTAEPHASLPRSDPDGTRAATCAVTGCLGQWIDRVQQTSWCSNTSMRTSPAGRR